MTGDQDRDINFERRNLSGRLLSFMWFHPVVSWVRISREA